MDWSPFQEGNPRAGRCSLCLKMPLSAHRLEVLHCTNETGNQVDYSYPNPQVAMALSALKPVVVQVKPILTFHPSGAAENVQNRFPTHVKNFACGLGS